MSHSESRMINRNETKLKTNDLQTIIIKKNKHVHQLYTFQNNSNNEKHKSSKANDTVGRAYLTASGVAGSTFGFCFWAGSSSCLLFQPSQPLATEKHIRRIILMVLKILKLLCSYYNKKTFVSFPFLLPGSIK